MDNFENIVALILGCNGKFKPMDSSNDRNFNLQMGDLILREMLGIKKIYHAGIFCGQNDVIQFSASSNQPALSSNWSVSCQSSSSQQTGQVDKVSVKRFISDQKCFVYRLKTGPPQDLQEKINTAMDDSREYHLLNNNCLHFALRLLGGRPGPMPRSQPMDEDEGSQPEELEMLPTQN